MATKNFSVRLDSSLKKQTETIYGELGLSLIAAINVFLRKSIAVGGFPFDVRLDMPNKETLLAFHEAETISQDSNVKGLNVDDALRELKK